MTRKLIVEADGGSRGNPGPAAFGAVVRDGATGAVLAELAEYIGETTNNVAEYRGAIAGIRHAFEIDPAALVEVRLDSKLVVEQMSGRWQVKSPDMRVLAKQARAIYPPGQVEYTWVPRERNRAADALVNEVLDSAVASGPGSIRRIHGGPESVTSADDVVGSIEELQSQAVMETRPRAVMIGWADVTAPTTTILARHGATHLSLEKRFSGKGGIDAPLAPLGIAQAEALAQEVLRREEIDRIVASPLLRTQETAAVVSAATGLPVETEPGFAECAFGDWDGHTFSEVKRRWPDLLDEWMNSTDVAPPGGESFVEVRARVAEARGRIVKKYPAERILVVSHVTPIKVMVGLAVDAPLTSVFRMELPPCSLTTLAWFADGNASMFSFAEAGHLHGVQGPTRI